MFCVLAEYVSGILELWSEHGSKKEAEDALDGYEIEDGIEKFSLHIKQEGVFYEIH